jgi:hypothetical protein
LFSVVEPFHTGSVESGNSVVSRIRQKQTLFQTSPAQSDT